MRDPFAPFTTTLPMAIRRCRAEDLPTLEWWGLFAPHRDLIRQVFDRQERDAGAIMLVVEANGMASGQAWLDLSRQSRDGTGVIWAVRVFPCLQGCGVGSRLMRAAEVALRAAHCRMAEVTVDKPGERQRRFYERLGYAEVASSTEPLAALLPPGAHVPEEGSQWVLRKRLDVAETW